jgi:hypothetical protein
MEVEDEYKLLQKLFFKKFGRELPEKKSDEVDIGIGPKDLTEEQKEMEAITSLAPVDIVKIKTGGTSRGEKDSEIEKGKVLDVLLIPVDIVKKESIKIDDTVKTVVNQVEEVDKVACFSLRQAPSEGKSDFNKMSSKQTSLLRIDIKSPSVDASQDENSSRREWRTLHQRTKGIVNTLIRISEHLEKIEMNKTTVEVTSYLSCASSLTKIIPGMLENLTKHFVREKVYFCESPPKPMYLTKLSRKEEKEMKNDTTSIQVPLPVVVKTEPIEIVAVRKSLRKSDVIPEKEDDKGRKDVADHTAKQFKLTSAGASSMPVGLTPRPDPNRTQQGPYNQAGPQFMGQHFGQPPPMFPNPPPTPPNLPTFQQHQAAARYLEKLPLTVNYNGIPKLKVPIFDGKLSEYQKFKLTFNTAYDNGRNLPKQHLVSLLEMSLQGKPLKFVSDFTKMSIDDSMYACMWQLLDDKYGDRNTEDEFTVGLFKDTLPIKNGSLTEVERIYEIFSIQHAYYLIKDPASLTMNTSLLFQSGIQKLNDDFFTEFFWFTEKYKLVPNFTALITFMQAEFLFAQKEERKQTSLSHKSDITFVKKSFENLNLNNDAMALSECTDLKDHQNKFSNQDEDDRSFFTNTRTGQRIPTRGLQNGNQGRTLERPSEESLGKRKGQIRPQPTASQFKEGHCSCCKKAHLIPECPKFKGLSKQKQSTIIRRDRLCYHCLEGPHLTRDCKKKEGRLCGKDGCEFYHHRILHREPNSSKFVGFQIENKIEPPITTPRK